MSAAERASEASSVEQANERTEERMAQYFTRRFHNVLSHCGIVLRFSEIYPRSMTCFFFLMIYVLTRDAEAVDFSAASAKM